MTFKRAALNHLRDIYDLPYYRFTSDDPISLRLEFITAIDNRSSYAYLADDMVPEILLTGVSGFEQAIDSPQQVVKMLLSRALLGSSDEPFKNLPILISPFSTEIFKNKDKRFSVSLGDLIEETDDEGWCEDYEINFNLWLAGKKERLTDQIYQIVRSVEEQYPGIIVAFLKSSFVSAFYEFDFYRDENVDANDLWDIFGWSLDLWDDYGVADEESE